jgi:hypothetical protein
MSHPVTRPSGRCPSCHRRFDLTADGLLRIHAADREKRVTCTGSGLRPTGPVRA